MNQNSIQYDPTLFAGTASYYSRYRFPYPQQFFDYLIRTFGFDGTGSALDLGCGPGSLTILLASSFNKVVAMDPNDEMLQEARRAAEAAKKSNIEFVKGSSWDLSPKIGPFRFAIMG
ncbi:MAG TPA: class I SAM-dependent methyltransferase, partial [Candidatus Angelobacter sp.]|nr:class I SAM-dependent methyltransferase [Candidatus Angelobacter sp.]